MKLIIYLYVVGDRMKDTVKEMLALAELIRELKSREFDKKYPMTYKEGWLRFEERVKQLEIEIEAFRKENKNETNIS